MPTGDAVQMYSVGDPFSGKEVTYREEVRSTDDSTVAKKKQNISKIKPKINPKSRKNTGTNKRCPLRYTLY